MTLMPLLLTKNDHRSLDFDTISESDLSDLETEVFKKLPKKPSKSSKKYVTANTLRARFHKTRVQLSLYKNGTPYPSLMNRYLTEPVNEVKRLRSVNKIVEEVFSAQRGSTSTKLIPVGQCFELADEMRDAGFHVFTHVQNLYVGMLSDLITHRWRQTQKNTVDIFHRIWRIPGEAQTWKNVNAYRKSRLSLLRDCNNGHSLLSVDALFSRTTYGGSALYFYFESSNGNVQLPRITDNLMKYFGLENAKNFKTELETLISWVKEKNVRRYNLICIPKELIENEKTCFVYRSHAGGVECRCLMSDHQTFLETLNQHQRGIAKHCATQYRILTHPLDTHLDVKTYTFDSLDVNQRKEYAQRINRITKLADDIRGTVNDKTKTQESKKRKRT